MCLQIYIHLLFWLYSLPSHYLCHSRTYYIWYKTVICSTIIGETYFIFKLFRDRFFTIPVGWHHLVYTCWGHPSQNQMSLFYRFAYDLQRFLLRTHIQLIGYPLVSNCQICPPVYACTDHSILSAVSSKSLFLMSSVRISFSSSSSVSILSLSCMPSFLYRITILSVSRLNHV